MSMSRYCNECWTFFPGKMFVYWQVIFLCRGFLSYVRCTYSKDSILQRAKPVDKLFIAFIIKKKKFICSFYLIISISVVSLVFVIK